MFVVVHLAPHSRSMLAEILARSGPLPAVAARDGMAIVPGRIVVAPSDRHLLVERDRVRVVKGPRENRSRPAIDPLFRSAAWAHGPRVVGVVLTGQLDDGTAGLWAIKSCGGLTVVQDPGDAEYPAMPDNALTHNRIDHRLPLEEIAPLLARLAREPLPAGGPVPQPPATLADEIAFPKLEREPGGPAGMLGRLTPFTCPPCRGALWELDEGGHLRYRCHTGHSFTHANLIGAQDIAIEDSLYTALRAVEEKAAALRRIAERWTDTHPTMQGDYLRRADELEASADLLRALLAGERPAAHSAPE